MAGTILLITAFGHRGFVVGTAFSKTEAVQAALVTALWVVGMINSINFIDGLDGLSSGVSLRVSARGRSRVASTMRRRSVVPGGASLPLHRP